MVILITVQIRIRSQAKRGGDTPWRLSGGNEQRSVHYERLRNRSPVNGRRAVDARQKRRVLPVNAEITIEGNLIPVGGMAARITPERYETIRQVLDGDITIGTPENYKKFIVTPPNDSELWEIDSNGCLEKQ